MSGTAGLPGDSNPKGFRRGEPEEYIRGKIDQVARNLKSGWPLYWLLLYPGVIILLLAVFYLVPQDVKNSILILHIPLTNSLSLFLSGYTHSGQGHLLNNIAGYLIGITFVFAFEDNKKILAYSSALFFTLVVLLSSGASIAFFEMKGLSGITSQGFSAVVAAFYAYGTYSLIRFVFEDLNHLRMPPFRTMNTPLKFLFIALMALFASALLLVILNGLEWGRFIQSGAVFTNGIAHFTGFLLGLFIPALLSTRYREKAGVYTAIYNILVAMAAVFGIILYLKYLV